MTILLPIFGGVVAFATIWGIAYVIYEKVEYDINVLGDLSKKVLAPFTRRKAELTTANELYMCGSCQKLSRRYQQSMYIARHGKVACPHCEQPINANKYDDILNHRSYSSSRVPSPLSRVSREDSWMASHGDCPKITTQGHKEVTKTVLLMQKLRAEEQEVERFQKYNNIKIDYSWVKNLQKEEEKPAEKE